MNSSRQYVVLHHTGIAEPHFDFMLAIDDTGPLLTWRLPRWPMRDGDTATSLPPHRRAYLEYEGPIAGNRGEVRRVARGHADFVARSATELVLRLSETLSLRLPLTSP